MARRPATLDIVEVGRYDIGDMPEIRAVLTPPEGSAAVSTACTFKVRDPSGNEATFPSTGPAVTSDGDNVWVLTMQVLDEAGLWFIRCTSPSGLIGAEECFITVRESQFAAP